MILIVFYRNHLDRIRDFWWVIGAFVFSMVGDAFLSNKGDDEMMFVYGIVGTLTSSVPTVGSVQFLVAGQPVDTLTGHITLSAPITPLSDWSF